MLKALLSLTCSGKSDAKWPSLPNPSKTISKGSVISLMLILG